MTPRVLGIVTGETGRFICRRCQQEVGMVAIIDQRDVRAKIWRETEPHPCVAETNAASRETKPLPHETN